MNSGLHRHLKICAVFIIVLLVACTFAARPLRYMLTPKVDAVTVKKRRMEYTAVIPADEWYTDNMTSVSLHMDLNRPLRVETLYIDRLDDVQAGDSILQFDAESGMIALDAAETDYLRARIEYEEYVRDNGRTTCDRLTLIEKNYRRAEQTLDTLNDLKANNWYLNAEKDGFISDIDAYSGMQYYGSDVLYRVSSPGSAMILYVPVDMGWQKHLTEYGVDVKVKTDRDEYTAEWQMTERRQGAMYARLIVNAAPASVAGMRMVYMKSVSTDSYFIVPESALDGDVLYVLRQTDSYFGKEYTVRAVTVEKGNTNGYDVEIIRGLTQGDRVVTAVRGGAPLYDGERVTLEIG